MRNRLRIDWYTTIVCHIRITSSDFSHFCVASGREVVISLLCELGICCLRVEFWVQELYNLMNMYHAIHHKKILQIHGGWKGSPLKRLTQCEFSLFSGLSREGTLREFVGTQYGWIYAKFLQCHHAWLVWCESMCSHEWSICSHICIFMIYE